MQQNQPPMQTGGNSAGDWCLRNSPWRLAGNIIVSPKQALRYKQAMTVSLLSMIVAFFGLVIPDVCGFFNVVPFFHIVPILLPCCKRTASAFAWSLISVCSIIGSIVTFFFGLLGGCVAQSGVVCLVIVLFEVLNLYFLNRMDAELRGKLKMCFQECGCCIKESQVTESQNPNTNVEFMDKKAPPQQQSMGQNYNGKSMDYFTKPLYAQNTFNNGNYPESIFSTGNSTFEGNSYYSNDQHQPLQNNNNFNKQQYRPPFMTDSASEIGSQVTIRTQNPLNSGNTLQKNLPLAGEGPPSVFVSAFGGSKTLRSKGSAPPPGLNVPTPQERAFNTGKTVVSANSFNPNMQQTRPRSWGKEMTTESNVAQYNMKKRSNKNLKYDADVEFEGMSQIGDMPNITTADNKRKSTMSLTSDRGSLRLDMGYQRTGRTSKRSAPGSVVSAGSMGYSTTMRRQARNPSFSSTFEIGLDKFKHKSRMSRGSKKTPDL